MDFFQTKMGAAFFNGQLPRLIRALEKIGDEMEMKRLADEKAKAEEIVTEETNE